LYPYRVPLNHLYTIVILLCMDAEFVGGALSMDCTISLTICQPV
jgi:hypothetical protein